MTVVLATLFDVAHAEGTRPDDSATRLKDLAYAWIPSWYTRHNLQAPVIPTESGIVRPIDGHLIEVKQQTGDSEEELWTISWSRPDDSDSSLKWSSVILIARCGEKTEFSLVIRVEPIHFEVRPIRVVLRPPRLLKSIIRETSCQLAGFPLTTDVELLDSAAVPPFVAEVLKNSDRRVPAVVVSPRTDIGVPCVNPALLAESLAGIGRVYYLTDKWATYALTESVTSRYACFDGAVRVFWPKFGTREDLAYHPVYLKTFFDPMSPGVGENRLFNMIAEHSAVRATPGEVTRAAQAAILARGRRIQVEGLNQLEGKVARGEASALELRGRVDEITQERDEALQLVEDERTRREGAERQLLIAEARSAPPPTMGSAPSTPETVAEAVSRAERLFSEELTMTDKTRRSARESLYRDPDKVLHAFEALADLVHRYFEAGDGAARVGPLEVFFRSRGALEYAASESETTRGKFGVERSVTWEGRSMTLERHLTLGGGSRENCLQIYWEFLPDRRKILVGHCGVHLEYARHRT
jgi:hypothetical protein